jgi:tetratricopeptide (TPR) repeat protein
LAAEGLDRGDGLAKLIEDVKTGASEALAKAAERALSEPEHARVLWGVRILQCVVGGVDTDALLGFVTLANRDYAVSWLRTKRLLEQDFTLREEAYWAPGPNISGEQDKADVYLMAKHSEGQGRYVEAYLLYRAAERTDEAVALLAKHSLKLRRQGQAKRMYDLVFDVDPDTLDWLNRIRLWVIKADCLGWLGDPAKAEEPAELGLKLIASKPPQQRATFRLEEVKLLIRRSIPPLRRGDFETAHRYLQRAKQELENHVESMLAQADYSEEERVAAVEQELILKNNLGLLYLNLALEHKAEDAAEADRSAHKAKLAFESGFETARRETHCKEYEDYFSHLGAQLELGLARYHEQWEQDSGSAIEEYREALQVLTRLGVNMGASDCANSLAVCLAGTGDFDSALEYAQESLQLAQKLEDDEGVAMAYATMSYDIYLAQAKQADNPAEKDKVIEKARQKFFRSFGTWEGQRGASDSADLLNAWQAILAELLDMVEVSARSELMEYLERVNRRREALRGV